jgi:hypothetical protein
MNKSEKIALQIARLEAEKQAALDAERRADQAELIRLIERADCLPEALEWVRTRGSVRRAKPAKNQQEA